MSYIGNQPTNTAFLVDTFSGNGSTTSFTMTIAPATANSVFVIVSGVVQSPLTYSVVNNQLTFSQAPPTGTNNIVCRYLALPASNVTTTAYRNYTELTATAGQTTFTVSSYTPGFIDVYRNGIKLNVTSYTATNGTTVTLGTAANAGDTVSVTGFYVSSVLNAIPNISGSVGPGNYDTTGQGGSGALLLPTGSTSQRPASPAAGMIRFNNTNNWMEYYTGSTWVTPATQNTIVYSYTGANQTFAVPPGATMALVKIWGAAGGASGNYGGTYTMPGGAGGYVSGIIPLINLNSLTIVVGGAGAWSSTNSSNLYSGGGGGYSGIFNGTVTQANALAIAGGGGGAAAGSSTGHGPGGGGGGSTGGAGVNDNRVGTQTGGQGGTQSAGGAAGTTAYGTGYNIAGSALQGGYGAGANTGGGGGQSGAVLWGTAAYGGGSQGAFSSVGNWPGGSGGGGYYGGGGGAQGYGGGGGGGSSYIGLMLGALNLQGGTGSLSTTAYPPATTDPNYISGIATSPYNSAPGNGLVVISYY